MICPLIKSYASAQDVIRQLYETAPDVYKRFEHFLQ